MFKLVKNSGNLFVVARILFPLDATVNSKDTKEDREMLRTLLRASDLKVDFMSQLSFIDDKPAKIIFSTTN